MSEPVSILIPCDRCDGVGRVYRSTGDPPHPLYGDRRTCEKCQGRGVVPNRALIAELERLREINTDLRQQVAVAKAERDAAQSEVAQLYEEESQTTNVIVAHRELCGKLRRELDAALAEIERLKTEYAGAFKIGKTYVPEPLFVQDDDV